MLKPPTYAGIAIELTPPTPKVRRTIVTTESGSRPRRREHATDESLEHGRAESIHRSGWCRLADISERPIDII